MPLPFGYVPDERVLIGETDRASMGRRRIASNLNSDIDAFLAAGNKINKIPAGVMAGGSDDYSVQARRNGRLGSKKRWAENSVKVG